MRSETDLQNEKNIRKFDIREHGRRCHLKLCFNFAEQTFIFSDCVGYKENY